MVKTSWHGTENCWYLIICSGIWLVYQSELYWTLHNVHSPLWISHLCLGLSRLLLERYSWSNSKSNWLKFFFFSIYFFKPLNTIYNIFFIFLSSFIILLLFLDFRNCLLFLPAPVTCFYPQDCNAFFFFASCSIANTFLYY